MPTSLFEALAVINPGLPRPFFDDGRLAALEKWGRSAPPVAWAGFECPLGESERWVDFHQGFKRETLPHLTSWLENRARDEIADRSWIAPLLKFCDEWGRIDSLFSQTVPNLIFEYDVRDHPDRISSPSVFVALGRDEGNGGAIGAAGKATLIERVLTLFMEPAHVSMLMRGIKRCIGSAPANASVSHLGLMLARTQSAVRLNLHNLRFDQIAPFLDAIGRKASTEGLDELLADLFAFAERISLCVDVGEEIGIPIGLECSTYQRDMMRWTKFLGHLVERSACTDTQRDCLQKWWGRATPALAPWPANLIVEELLADRDQLGVIDRYLSHIKITWQPAARLKVKAYLGFVHHFMNKPEPSPLPTVATQTPMSSLGGKSRDHKIDLEGAISAGMEFLLRNRLCSGLWQDFPGTGADDPWVLTFGASDEWVSAYVAAAVGAFERKDAKDAANWVWRLLCHRRHQGAGWGHSCISPTDADSVIWALHLAHVIGTSKSGHATAAYDFLRQHQRGDGGIATYLPNAGIRRFADPSASVVNAWCEPHVCVTAAATNLPEMRDDCIRYLRSTQKEDGRWDAYWWMDSEYSTGLATAAMARSYDPADQARVEAAVKWTINGIGSSGGVFSAACKAEAPFATAWSLRALLSVPKHALAREQAIRVLQWLLGEQRSDGSWCGSAWLRTPPVNVRDPDGSVGSILVLDRNANFTTATVLTSLGVARGIW